MRADDLSPLIRGIVRAKQVIVWYSKPDFLVVKTGTTEYFVKGENLEDIAFRIRIILLQHGFTTEKEIKSKAKGFTYTIYKKW